MKKFEIESSVIATISFTEMSVCATLIFTILLSEEIMLPVRLIMAFTMVATAALIILGLKNLWLMIGGIVSAIALFAHNPAGGLAYLAYIAIIFLFFRANPICAKEMKNWWNGIFAHGK